MKNVFGILVLIFSTGLWAGVVFEIETKENGKSEGEISRSWTDGENLKMEIHQSGNREKDEMVFRGDEREMLIVDHNNQSVMVIDAETFKNLMAQISPALKQMEQALKNVPESQRAAIEKMMKGKMPTQMPKGPEIEVRKTGDSGKQAGYPCVKYDVYEDGVKVRELWVTDWKNIEGAKEFSGIFEEMAGFFDEMMEALGGLRGNMSKLGNNIFAQMKNIDGFPVVTRELSKSGSVKSESTLRSSKKIKIDPSEFEPPAGYKRQSLMGR